MRLSPSELAGKPGNRPTAPPIKPGRDIPAGSGGDIRPAQKAASAARSGKQSPLEPPSQAGPEGLPQTRTAPEAASLAAPRVEAGTGEKAGAALFSSVFPQITNQEGLKQLALGLGLAPDPLSAALLAFGRYFSLPLEPDLFLKLRQNVLFLMENRSLKASSSRTFRDAAALAAAAAADKGVELSPEALENYADAIDPGDSQPEGRGSPEGRGDERRRGAQEEEPLEPENIREKAGEIEADKPFLRILNQIPGKNGRRWLVFPLVFFPGGVEFRVSIRILLKENPLFDQRVERLAVDVSSEDRRWLFILDKAGTPQARIDISIDPPPEKARFAALEGEIRGILKEFAGQIGLWNKGEGALPGVAPGAASFGADSRNEVLPSVNEEV